MAHFGDNTEEMKVVCFEDVENHLKQVASSKYDVMISQYVTLLNFLVSEETLKSSQKLSFEIMNVGEYKQDLRRFLSLNTFPLDDTQLLVMHVKNVIARPEKSLTEEIIACYDENYFSKENVYQVKRSIRDKVNAAVQTLFPQFDLSVQLIRSCHTELISSDSTLHMGVIVPKCSSEDPDEFAEFQERHKSLNNMDNYIECLEEIGMVDIHYAPGRCSSTLLFTDSISGNLCDISIDRTLLYEREKLIEAYLELDKRIRPLINAILHFCQGHHIKNADGYPSLSTYSIIIMVLNFLINGLEYPVIPNLQNISRNNECDFEDCLFTKNKDIIVTVIYAKRIRKMMFRYHTCVITQHNGDSLDIIMENRTLWNGQNIDSLGSLLIGFFQYYSNRKNLTGGVSISRVGGSRRGLNYFHPVVISDPFLPINNISPDTVEKIIETFYLAWEALTDEKNFEFICGGKLLL
ncbi:uncharacterized protein EV154DRAFT_565762 [Mucor mucedo]|uniref:uncharacterized protein n=1 Tax=Mucor mucedo TaxID=29922 RepID=UPI002220F3AF|nr:uncharacterized protein EV154DRAFT_565762 [Mucor mucedo]KAI7889115.1 hypothetical protein EV154DRAFT_565762 [Mucor mucedo]